MARALMMGPTARRRHLPSGFPLPPLTGLRSCVAPTLPWAERPRPRAQRMQRSLGRPRPPQSLKRACFVYFSKAARDGWLRHSFAYIADLAKLAVEQALPLERWGRGLLQRRRGIEICRSNLYFEDLRLGDRWVSPTRTITEEDVTGFARLTGDHNPLHLDGDFARQSPFGRPIAHGLLGLSFAAGLASDSPRVETVAFLSVHEWRFLKPVYFGDRVHVVTEIGQYAPSRPQARSSDLETLAGQPAGRDRAGRSDGNAWWRGVPPFPARPCPMPRPAHRKAHESLAGRP